ncbi:hypothetical protein SDC9_139807 [bioreactor metagenome]|uniref:Uncharacterized protein n=1 Tax=bioreactor metagenome TaxID=1076179 RepID=A0A645DWF9_9ZZZZ
MLVAQLVTACVLLCPSDCQCAGRLQDGAGVFEDVLDCRADGIVVHQDHLVDIFLAQTEGFGADFLDRSAVSEDADLIEHDPFAGSQRLGHRVGTDRLHADDAGLRAESLDIGGDAGNQTSASDTAEHSVDGLRMRAQDVEADGALARNHVGIVKGMDEGQFLCFFQFDGMRIGVRVGLSREYHFSTAGPDRIDLDLRGGARHDDDCAYAKLLGRQGDALRVIAGRCADHATLECLGRQLDHLVIGPPQLEAEYRLHVLALDQHRIPRPRRQPRRNLQRRLHGDVVNLRVEDLFEVVGVHGVSVVAGETEILAVRSWPSVADNAVREGAKNPQK